MCCPICFLKLLPRQRQGMAKLFYMKYWEPGQTETLQNLCECVCVSKQVSHFCCLEIFGIHNLNCKKNCNWYSFFHFLKHRKRCMLQCRGRQHEVFKTKSETRNCETFRPNLRQALGIFWKMLRDVGGGWWFLTSFWGHLYFSCRWDHHNLLCIIYIYIFFFKYTLHIHSLKPR